MYKVPILLLVFNRPETTKKVFGRIRELSPLHLYIAADGPRENNTQDIEQCSRVREIVSSPDWPCQLNTLYRDKNLGCRIAVTEAINWFFDHVDEGIVLEDDCYPSLSFFSFCMEMLSLYRADTRIFHITGNNFQDGILRSNNSHYFSKYNHVWGWATWRRAWKFYEKNMESLSTWVQDPNNTSWFSSSKEKKYWIKKFTQLSLSPTQNSIWDYIWTYTCWRQHALSIVPVVNLVKNLGIGSGTNTIASNNHLIKEAQEANFIHIKENNPEINHLADLYTFKRYFAYKGTILSRILYHLKKRLEIATN